MIPHVHENVGGNKITKQVLISVDLKHARNMLVLDGYSMETVKSWDDAEVFRQVVDHISCYGGEYTIGGIING